MQVEGLANFRDLGGRRRASGPATPRGVFFRAANVDGVTAAGRRTIRRAGIRTVVDLRRPDERVADRPGSAGRCRRGPRSSAPRPAACLDVDALLQAGAMSAADRRALYSWRGTPA